MFFTIKPIYLWVRVWAVPTLIPACLTDRRLKIRLSRLPERVRRRVSSATSRECELVFFGRVRTTTSYGIDGGYVRVYVPSFYFNLLVRLVRAEQAEKPLVGVEETADGWAITYREELDGATLYIVLGYLWESRALLSGFVKTSKGIILPMELYQALTNMDGLGEEIGKIKVYRPIVNDLLGMPHANIPIQLDLWGREVVFRGKGQTTLYGHPIQT